MSESIFTVFEDHLATELGLSRDELRAWRGEKLRAGTDFEKVHKHVRWSEEAKARFMAEKKLAPGPASTPPASVLTPAPVETAPPGEKNAPPPAQALEKSPAPPVETPAFPEFLYFLRALVNAHVIWATEQPNNDRETQPIWSVQVHGNKNFARNQKLPVKPRPGWERWAILDGPCPRPGQRHIPRHADSPFGRQSPGTMPPAPGMVAAEAGSIATV